MDKPNSPKTEYSAHHGKREAPAAAAHKHEAKKHHPSRQAPPTDKEKGLHLTQTLHLEKALQFTQSLPDLK